MNLEDIILEATGATAEAVVSAVIAYTAARLASWLRKKPKKQKSRK